MAYRAEPLLDNIHCKDDRVKLTAIRKIKNQVIGNKRRKVTFIKLNTVDSIAELLTEHSDHEIRIQSAILLSSLSRADTSCGAFLRPPMCYHSCLQMLDSSHDMVTETGLRAICSIAEVGP